MAGQREGAVEERVADGRASWRPVRLTRQFGRTRAQGAIPEGTPEAIVLRRDALYRRALAAVDVLAAAVAVLLGVVVIGDDGLTPLALLAWPLIIAASKTVGLYDRDEHLLRKTTLEEAPRLFHLATLYALGLWLAGGLIVSGSLGREQVLGVWAFLFVAMVLARTGVRRLVSRLVPEERCLVLGDSQASEHLAKKLRGGHSLKATVVGRVPFEDGDDRISGGELGSMGALGAVLARHDVQRVIIAPRTAGSDAILDAIRVVKSLGVKVSLLPRLFEVVGSSVEFDDVDGTMVLGLRRRGLTNSSYVLKRTTDVIGSIVGLALAAPVLVAIAVAVRTTSPGPILFRQTRTGRRGGDFRMLKFRTMVEEADELKAALRHLNEAHGVFKLAEDPRTTRVGRFLRRTSLDELPQLFNVLRGDMSLVGPRPLVLDEDQLVHGWGRGRLAVAPGMTGLWQIFGSSRIPLEEMVKIDYLYVANWSLWLDVKILLRTVPYVLSARGL